MSTPSSESGVFKSALPSDISSDRLLGLSVISGALSSTSFIKLGSSDSGSHSAIRGACLLGGTVSPAGSLSFTWLALSS